ncbi:MAG: hypothetical protein ACLQLH_03445 [Terracidiphilus sp.]
MTNVNSRPRSAASQKRKPKANRKPPQKKSEETPRLSDLEKAFCLLAETKGITEAAIKLGLSAADARELQKRGTVKRYQESYRKAFLKEMARAEVRRIVKLNVTREDIVSGLYSLAIIPPDSTKGTILGQVNAYNSLSELLGLKLTARDADNFFKGKSPEELENYARHGSFSAPAESKA